MARTKGSKVVIAVVAGVATTFVGIATTAAIAYAQKDWSNPVGIVIVAVLAGVAALIPLLQQTEEKVPAGGVPVARGHAPVPQFPGGYGAAPAPRYPVAHPAKRVSRRVPIIVALVILVLCGGGAYGVTTAVQYVGGYVTGNETGSDRLVVPVSGTAGGLTLDVTSVVVTSHFTRVGLTAHNQGSGPVSLPVFRNAQLSSASGKTLLGDPYRSDWPTSVPPGGQVTGTIIFPHSLGSGPLTASFSFTTVVGPGGGSITVDGLQLAA